MKKEKGNNAIKKSTIRNSFVSQTVPITVQEEE
jgi:hypothetical protein